MKGRTSAAVAIVGLVAIILILTLYATRTERPAASPGPTAAIPSPSPTPISTVAAATASPSPSPGVLDVGRVPERVTISGRSFRIEAYLWRDFMPISPPDGKPLIASVRVLAEDGQTFPPTITADRVWVYGPEVWEAAPSEVVRSPEGGTRPSEIEVVAREGPKWDPGTKVDVVLRLRSGADPFLVRVRGVTIERTS